MPMTPGEIRIVIRRIAEKMSELEKFDIRSVRDGATPELTRLSVSIMGVLEKAFGEGTSRLSRFAPSADLNFRPGVYYGDYPGLQDYKDGASANIKQALSLLSEAKRSLEEDLEDIAALAPSLHMDINTRADSRKIFLVHGHDLGMRESVAAFLRAAEFEPIILAEQVNEGQTVIEKFEKHGGVGFAIILLTPDDIGGQLNQSLNNRARQNVILELGYFIGRLGRNRVCALKNGDIEMPSDFHGIAYQPFDGSGAWKISLGKELQAAGYLFSFDKALKSV